MDFNPHDKEHKAIVISAMVAADALGAGRITAATEQLELNDITVKDTAQLHRYIFAWGSDL